MNADTVFLILCIASFFPALWTLQEVTKAVLVSSLEFRRLAFFVGAVALVFLFLQVQWVIDELSFPNKKESVFDFAWEFMDAGIFLVTGMLVRYVVQRKRSKIAFFESQKLVK